MRIALGLALASAVFMGTTAWGQAQPGAPTQPRADNPAQGTPATRNAERAIDRAGGRNAQPTDNVNQPGGRRVDVQVGGQPGAQPGRQIGQRGGSADAQIASLLAMGNRNEIEISKFAQERLQNEDAREFAANMIKEHTPAMQRLQQFASQQGPARGQRDGAANASDEAEGEQAPGAIDQNRPVRQRPADGAAEAGRQRRPGLAWGQVHRELADQCLESTRKALEEHKGADFDKAYLGQQIVAHMEMIDKLTVLRNHASSDLQQEIDSQLTSAKEHLDHAKKLMHSNKDRPSPQAAREGAAERR